MAYYIDEENSEITFEVQGDRVILKYGRTPSEGGGGESVYLIKKGDTTTPTDNNTFSALRILAELLEHNEELGKIFLSSVEDDEAAGIITFLKGLISQGLIKALAGLEVGENGSGISVLPDGKTQAVVDYLYVKVKAIFDELEVKKKTYVGGEQVLSPAGMKCIRVEELTDSYRCFFKAEEDGVEIGNQFTPGTLAIAQECNIKVGVSHHVGNRYYWREVTAVGTDYIELSKTKCDPNIENDIPATGDDIVGLGHKTDITRQGAIVLSSVNEVAPSIIMYQGIDSFSLVDKEVIGFDFSKATGRARMRVYGDAYIGAKDRSSYIEYTQDGLEVKAKKIVLGTGDTLDETLSDLNQSVSDINNQLDQSFQIWQGETADTPTLTNKPASDWKTDADKSLHVDDFYITTEGLCYQFDLAGSVYQWKPVTDKYLIAYVQQIGEKKRVFVNRPADAVSYDVGDCWVNANYTDGSGKVLYNNDRLVCVTAKAAGTAFSISHWKKDSKYTDDTKAEESFDYTDKKVLELQAYADKSAQAKADAAAVLAKGYADGIVTKSEANAIDAANRYAEAQDELLKIATDAYADGVVSEEEKRAIADAQAKADAAKKAAQDYADKMDAETETKLLKTGINIEKNTIIATADKFTVQGRDGKIYAVFEVDSDTGLPMMKADYIKVTSLLVENAIEAGGLNIDDKFVVDIVNGKAVVRLVGEVNADKGVIGGIQISGNSLTNEGFNNDAYIILRNDPNNIFCGIGGNVLPATSGIRAVARFENRNDAGLYGSANIGLMVSAQGAPDNIAIMMGGGHITRFAECVQPMIAGGTVNLNTTCVLCLNTADITITLPTMQAYDDGHVIEIKNMSGFNVTINTGYGYQSNGDYQRTYMHVNRGDRVTSYVLDAAGDASRFVYARDVNNGTLYGCWVQFKHPRDW